MTKKEVANRWIKLVSGLQKPVVSTIKQVWGPFAKIYVAWILIHYASAHAYTYLCTPSSMQGFLMSPLLASSPHCSALRWAIGNGANTLNTMWIAIGGYVTSKLLSRGSSSEMELPKNKKED